MTDNTQDHPAETGEEPDQQEKYRQALERKKHQGWAGVGGAKGPDAGKGHPDSHRAGGTREFRRKSG